MGKALMCGLHGMTLANAEEFQLGGLLQTTTESTHQYYVSEDATFSGLRGRIASGGSGTNTFRFRKNAGNGNQVASISGTGTFEDTTNSDACVAGDLYNIAYTDTGTDSVVNPIAMNVEFASGHGKFHGCSPATAQVMDVGGSTRYLPIEGVTSVDGNATIANVQHKVREYTSIEAFQVTVGANVRVNNSVFSVNVNGTDVGTAITFGAGVSGRQQVTGMGIALSPGDLVCISMTLGAGVEDLTFAKAGVTLKSTNGGSENSFTAGSTRVASATANYYSLGHGSGTTAAVNEVKVGFAARCKNLRCYLSANTYTADATLRLMVNGVAQLTTTITAGGGAGWYENTSDTFDIDADDTVEFEIVGGTSGSITVQNIIISFGAIPFSMPPVANNYNRRRAA